jgi:dihydrodipicolinate reductase
MMQFAAQAAALESVGEIIELHHRNKADALLRNHLASRQSITPTEASRQCWLGAR